MPWVESYLRRWALVAVGTRSFSATISTSGFPSAARRNPRPIRPNPLIATRVATGISFVVMVVYLRTFEHGHRQFLHIVHQAISPGNVHDGGRDARVVVRER